MAKLKLMLKAFVNMPTEGKTREELEQMFEEVKKYMSKQYSYNVIIDYIVPWQYENHYLEVPEIKYKQIGLAICKIQDCDMFINVKVKANNDNVYKIYNQVGKEACNPKNKNYLKYYEFFL